MTAERGESANAFARRIPHGIALHVVVIVAVFNSALGDSPTEW